jgi:hypothetical protein
VNSPYKGKWWTNSGGPLVNSLLWVFATFQPKKILFRWRKAVEGIDDYPAGCEEGGWRPVRVHGRKWGRKSPPLSHKTSGFKTSSYKTSGFKTSNVRYTKGQVYKMSGLQNVRFSKRPVAKKHPYIFCTCGWWKSAGSVAAMFTGKVMAVFYSLF